MQFLFHDFFLPHLLRDGNSPAGGWASQLHQWLLALAEGGHQSGVLTFKGAKELTPYQEGFELIETYDPSRGIRILKHFYSYVPTLLECSRQFAPDVIVQSTKGLDAGIMAWIAGRLQVPFVHSIASDIDADGRYAAELPAYATAAYRYGLRRSDLIVCQNEYQLGQLRQRYPDKRLHHMENVFAIPRSAPLIKPRAERRYVAWVSGWFRKAKNLPLLAEVAEACPDLLFRIAGMLPPDADKETRLALDRLTAMPNVSLVGLVKRDVILEFFSGATALLCTSHYEGFPNTFLEAFAVGTPVVTRQTVDPNGIVSRNALGVVAADDALLVGGLRDISSMPGDAFDSLARKCRQYVEREHAPGPNLRRLVQVIQSLPLYARNCSSTAECGAVEP